MATNKTSRYELKPYVSMYTDPGTVQTAAILRERWEKGREQYDLLQRTAGMARVGQGDKWIKDQAIGNINDELGQVVQNNNFENAGVAISGAVNRYSTDPAMLAALESQKVRDEYEKEIRARRQKGETILFDQEVVMNPETGKPMLDENGEPVMRDKWDNHSSWVQDANGEMIANVYEPQGETKLAWDEKQQKLVADIAHDPVFLTELQNISGLDGANLSHYLRTGYLASGKQISQEKADMIAEKMSEVYLTSNEGLQQLKYLTSTQVDENGDLLTPEKAAKIIQDEMKAIASKQVGADLQYQKNAYIDAKKSSSGGGGSRNTINNGTNNKNYVNNRVHTIETAVGHNSISSIRDLINTDENGNIDFDNFDVGGKHRKFKDVWENNPELFFNFSTDEVANDRIPIMFDDDQYEEIPEDERENPNIKYRLKDNAKPKSSKVLERHMDMTRGHAIGNLFKNLRMNYDNTNSDTYVDAQGNTVNKKTNNYFTKDGNYNFDRNFAYSDAMDKLENDMRKNGASEADIIAARQKNHEKVIENLGKIFTEEAGQLDPTEVDNKTMKRYFDEYMGYILHNQRDVRYAQDSNGRALFANDQEFLEWHSAQIERFESRSFNATSGNANWAEAMKEYWTRGTLISDNGKINGNVWYNHEGNITKKGSIVDIAKVIAKHQHSEFLGKNRCIANNYSCMDQKNTRSAITLAMQSGKGMQFQGILPGANGPGSFKVRIKVDAETTGLGKDYNGTPFYVDLEMGGTAEMRKAFQASYAMHSAALDGTLDQHGKDNPLVSKMRPDGNILRGFYEFNADTRQYEPTFQVVSPDGQVLQQTQGDGALNSLMNAEMDAFTLSGSELGALLGEKSKGVINNP